MSDWGVEYRCRACDVDLSYRQVMNSGGCCPACGHLSEGTVVEYRKVVFRWNLGQKEYRESDPKKIVTAPSTRPAQTY